MPTTKLFISEPFEIPFAPSDNHSSTKRIKSEHVKQFWKSKAVVNYADKQGCYVFATRAGRGYRVWYVGKTKNKFSGECFQAHKLEKYNEVLFEGRRGTPVLFFVAPRDGVRVVDKNELASMEKQLIQIAYAKNPELKNVHGTRVETWVIDGLIRSGKGKPSAKAKRFRTMMGLT
jgi:hypothetical protein